MKANSEIPARECILCAEIDVVMSELTFTEDGMERESTCVSAILPVNHTQEDYDNFIKKLDVEYDDGYGTQELFGTIWLTDGTWMDRGEYDGSEWWCHREVPEIPDHLEHPHGYTPQQNREEIGSKWYRRNFE